MRTMLLGTAAVGLVATLLTLPPTRTGCVTRCATQASAKVSACRAVLVYYMREGDHRYRHEGC
jgi:hypothetical protein